MHRIRKQKMRDAVNYFMENEKIMIGECSKIFNVDRGTLRNNLKRMGIETNRKKKMINENYFEIIDSPEKAYWLGFLLADGTVGSKNDSIGITLKREDRYILEDFAKAIELDPLTIYDYEANNNVMNKKYPSSELTFTSSIMKNHLSQYNIFPNKTKCEAPFLELEPLLIRHYIRGFFDGDGWISTYKRRPQDRCKNPKTELGFGSSYEMCDYLSSHFSKTLRISKKEPKKGAIHRIRYCSNSDIKKIGNYLYSDTDLYLKRKHKKFVNLCRLYPNL